jgi:hypothetical protein
MDDQTHPVINVEETIGKTVGKRKPGSAAERSRRIQETARDIYLTRGFSVYPKGVYRFNSHEEADEWMMKMAIRRATKMMDEGS